MWWQQVDFLPSFVLHMSMHILTWKTPVKCIKWSNRSHVHMQFKSLSLVYELNHSLYSHQQWWRDTSPLFLKKIKKNQHSSDDELSLCVTKPQSAQKFLFLFGRVATWCFKTETIWQSEVTECCKLISVIHVFTHMCYRAIMFWWESLILPGSLISVICCVDAQSNLKEGQFKQTTIVCSFSRLVWACAWLCLGVYSGAMMWLDLKQESWVTEWYQVCCLMFVLFPPSSSVCTGKSLETSVYHYLNVFISLCYTLFLEVRIRCSPPCLFIILRISLNSLPWSCHDNVKRNPQWGTQNQSS